MMPKRLLEPGSGASDLERVLLAAREEPYAGDEVRGAVWQQLVQSLALAPELGSEHPPTADAGADERYSALPDAAPELRPSAVAAGGKLAMPWGPVSLSGGIGVVVGVIATSSFFLLREPAVSPAPGGATPAMSHASPLEPAEPREGVVSEAPHESPPSVSVDELRPSPVETPRDQPQPVAAPSASSASAVSFAPQAPPELAASRLREEAALLRQAREQLGRGALDAADASLQRSRMQFPDSRLQQEREALTIELLVRRGLTTEAASAAKAFLEKYPHSPHVARVRRALGGGGGT